MLSSPPDLPKTRTTPEGEIFTFLAACHPHKPHNQLESPDVTRLPFYPEYRSLLPSTAVLFLSLRADVFHCCLVHDDREPINGSARGAWTSMGVATKGFSYVPDTADLLHL